MSYLEFDEKSYEQLQLYVEQGNTENMPQRLVDYLQAIELVRSLYDKYKSKKFILNLLMGSPYRLTEYKASKVYVDALNFFYSDNAVKREAWANIYAERFDKLATLCIAADDYEGAKKNWEIAVKLRMGEDRRQAIPRELLDRKPIFYTIKPKDLGFPEANRRKLAVFIDELEDIPSDVKMRLHREALTDNAEGNVLDVEFEDIPFVDGK